MTIKEFEESLKKLDENINIQESPQAPDVCGIYYKDIFMGIGIPSGNIYWETRSDYKDAFDTVHKNAELATAQVENWLKNKEEMIELEMDYRNDLKK